MAKGGAKEVIGQFLRAIKAADGKTMMSLLAEDAVVVLPGSYKVPWAGRWEGRDSIAQCFQLIGEFLEIRSHDLKLIFGEGEHVLVFMYETSEARNTGRVLHQDTAWLFRIRAGKIAFWQAFEDTEQIAWAWEDDARAWDNASRRTKSK